MSENPSQYTHHPEPDHRVGWRSVSLAACVIGLGLVASIYLLRTAPETQPESELNRLKVVQTRKIEPATHVLRIVGFGEVIPAQEVILSSEVSGRVVRHHADLVAGGHIGEGEEVFAIDESDYQIAVAEQKAALAEAQSDLQLEEGRQVVAAREWEQLKKELPDIEVNRDLVLRAPHRLKIEATINRARSMLDRANLDLERTSVSAPFNALVLEETVEVGQLVNVGDAVATLAGADEFWIQVSIRQEELPRIPIPMEGQAGAEARITLVTGAEDEVYRGRVVRLLRDLEPGGRNARVIVSVADPLGLKPGGTSSLASLPLLLRSFVRVEIDAGEITGALSLDQSLLEEDNQIWVVDGDDTLQIRQADVLWSQDDQIYLANTLEPGDEVVVNKLRVAIPGTKVQPQRVNREAEAE